MWLCTCAGASLSKSLKQKKCKIQLESNDHHCPPNLCACWQISCWGWGNPYVLGQISHFDLAAQSAYFGFLPATGGQERQQIWEVWAANMSWDAQQIWPRRVEPDVLNGIFHPCLGHFPISWAILHSHGITSERPPALIQIFIIFRCTSNSWTYIVQYWLREAFLAKMSRSFIAHGHWLLGAGTCRVHTA